MKGLNTKSVVVGAIAAIVVLKFVAPRVPALQGIVAKLG